MEKFIGVFFAFFEVQTTMVAEFYEVMHALKEAKKIGLTNIWLECDFALICVAFTAKTNVSWDALDTYLSYCGKIRFKVTHFS